VRLRDDKDAGYRKPPLAPKDLPPSGRPSRRVGKMPERESRYFFEWRERRSE
jgi:hypothetical protein